MFMRIASEQDLQERRKSPLFLRINRPCFLSRFLFLSALIMPILEGNGLLLCRATVQRFCLNRVSCQNFMENFAVHVRQPKVSAAETVGKPFVIDAE